MKGIFTGKRRAFQWTLAGSAELKATEWVGLLPLVDGPGSVLDSTGGCNTY